MIRLLLEGGEYELLEESCWRCVECDSNCNRFDLGDEDNAFCVGIAAVRIFLKGSCDAHIYISLSFFPFFSRGCLSSQSSKLDLAGQAAMLYLLILWLSLHK